MTIPLLLLMTNYNRTTTIIKIMIMKIKKLTILNVVMLIRVIIDTADSENTFFYYNFISLLLLY